MSQKDKIFCVDGFALMDISSATLKVQEHGLGTPETN